MKIERTRSLVRAALAIAATAIVGATVAAAGEVALAAPAAFDPDVAAVYLGQQIPTVIFVGETNGDGAYEFNNPTADDGLSSGYNALAFDVNTNYLYAALNKTNANGDARNTVIKIGQGNQTEVVTDAFGDPLILPDSGFVDARGTYNSATFGDDGLYYAMSSAGTVLTAVDVTGVTGRKGVKAQVPVIPRVVGEDMVSIDGFLWSIRDGMAVRLNPTDGTTQAFSIDNPITRTDLGSGYGAAWRYGNGNMGVSNNYTGEVVQLSFTDAASDSPIIEVISLQPGPTSGNSDATANPGPAVDLALDKSAAYVTAGDGVGDAGAATVDYHLVVTNTSTLTSSGYVVSDVLPVEFQNPTTATPGCQIAADTDGLNRLTCVGASLAPGASVTITITGVMAGGLSACVTNTATVTGNEMDPTLDNNIDSAEVCPDDLTITKDAELIDGATIKFTIAMTNTGALAYTTNYPATFVDDLTDVIDDMTFNNDAAFVYTDADPASNTADATLEFASPTLTWAGPLRPGETVRLTYTATLDASAPGNLLATNVVCVESPNNNLCDDSVTPFADLVVAKSAEPENGSMLSSGEVVTYTVTFDNSKGSSAATVDSVDDLSAVLDDASISAPPETTDRGLGVSDVTNGQFTITGSVAAGSIATVTYSAKVNPVGERGDNQLLNFVLDPGVPTPAACTEATTVPCTAHPVPELIPTKTANPPDGTTLVPGSTVNYTLTFDNSAGAVGAAVNWYDDLSEVLDDATVTKAPTLSDRVLAASPISAGQFSITGTVPAGKTVTVSYAITVLADGKRGDDKIANFLIGVGAEPPSGCASGHPLCTEHFVERAAISLQKSVASVADNDGSASNTPGDVVNYRFGVRNTGNVALSNVSLTDPLVSAAPLKCPKVALKAGETMNCRATYTLTAADGFAGNRANTATVTGISPTGNVVEGNDTYVLRVTNVPLVLPATGSGLVSRLIPVAVLLLAFGYAATLLGRNRGSGPTSG